MVLQVDHQINLPVEVLNIDSESSGCIGRNRSRVVNRIANVDVSASVVASGPLDIVPRCGALNAQGRVDSSMTRDLGSAEGQDGAVQVDRLMHHD